MYASVPRPVRLVSVLRWHPEWPAAVVVIFAWAALLVGSVWPSSTAVTTHGGHGSVLAALPPWIVMSVAMMLPVALPAVGHVAFNSLRRRRQRAMAVYVCVYVGVWVVFGLVAFGAVRWLRETASVDDGVLLAGALAIAAVWQVCRWKRRALNQCLRTVPLPPVGWRADVGCVHFAVRHGWRCLRSCWALMIVMAVVGHAGLPALGAMAALTALIAVEELTRRGSDVLTPSAGVLALAAGLVAVGRWA